MPETTNGSVRLHWESTGAGPPVLLVMGLGISGAGWWRTIPVLAEQARVISFDNRGIGRSDSPPGPYSTAAMAEDAVAVLDAAGEERAHVYGVSLGGMIAQEIALRHPDRVDRLVLGATTPGGDRAVGADESVMSFFGRRGQMPAQEAVWASVPYNYGPETRRRHADRIGADIVERLRFPVEPEGYMGQLGAALSHDAADRLGEVRAETLVVHGDADLMVPVANAHLLVEALPQARLRLCPGAGHLYLTDDPEADRDVARFLAGGFDP
jgi:pimeloyl-ACP methyl ester carboxylesterase